MSLVKRVVDIGRHRDVEHRDARHDLVERGRARVGDDDLRPDSAGKAVGQYGGVVRCDGRERDVLPAVEVREEPAAWRRWARQVVRRGREVRVDDGEVGRAEVGAADRDGDGGADVDIVGGRDGQRGQRLDGEREVVSRT